MTTCRIGFAGTPELASVCLDALVKSKLAPIAVLTQPDRRAGRRQAMTMPAVKQLALQHGLQVMQPHNLNDTPELREQLQTLHLDLLVVIAYGLIVPPWLLQMPTLGCINLHFSLLPRWRGAAPIQRAIQAGDTTTGLSLIQMDEGLDTGPLLASTECAIRADDTAGSLQMRLADAARAWLPEQVHAVLQRELQPQQQQGKSCYAHKIDKQEAWLNWEEPAEKLARKVMAFNPAPGAMTYTNDNHRVLKILRAHANPERVQPFVMNGRIVDSGPDTIRVVCNRGNSTLEIEQAQLAGGRAQSARELRNGHPHLFSPQHGQLSSLVAKPA